MIDGFMDSWKKYEEIMRIGDEDNDQQEEKMRKIRRGGGGATCSCLLCAGRLEVDADRVVDRFPRAVSVSCKRDCK